MQAHFYISVLDDSEETLKSIRKYKVPYTNAYPAAVSKQATIDHFSLKYTTKYCKKVNKVAVTHVPNILL